MCAVLGVCAVACATGELHGEKLEYRPGLFEWFTPQYPSPTCDLAKPRFDQAADDYRRERFRAAADGFMAAAALLRKAGMEEEPTAQVNRQWTYRNAAAAFEVAKAWGAGRAALTSALHEDPACADLLRDLLHELDERSRE